jgi:hypothetical protein
MHSLTNRTACFIALSILLSVPGFAGTITLVSTGALSNDGSGTTYAITPDPVWASPLTAPNGTASTWVSDVATTTRNSPVGSIVNFTDTFTLTGDPSLYFGSITVLADDSTSVILNGHQLQAVNLNQGTNCSNAPIGCLTSTQLTITLPSADFISGANHLSFGVRQGIANTPFGVDFAGVVSNAPEPATFGVFGLGMVVLSLTAARSRRARQELLGRVARLRGRTPAVQECKLSYWLHRFPW